MRLSWSRFVDIITIIWLIIFILTFIDFEGSINLFLGYAALSLIIVFILDLYFLYKKADNYHIFLKKQWFDIIMVIPFFRVLRILRVFKLLRATKSIKANVKLGEKTSKAVKKSKKLLRKKKH